MGWLRKNERDLDGALVQQAHTALAPTLHRASLLTFARDGHGRRRVRESALLSGDACFSTKAGALAAEQVANGNLYDENGERRAGDAETDLWGPDSADNSHAARDGCLSRRYRGRGVSAFVVDHEIRYSHDEFQPVNDTTGLASRASEFYARSAQRHARGVPLHGTHVAATIAGRSVGFAPDAKVLGCAVTGDLGGVRVIDSAAVAEALVAVAKSRARPAVVSMTAGATEYSYGALDAAIDHILAEAGVVVVRSAGNGRALSHLLAGGHSQRALHVAAARKAPDGVAQDDSYTNFGPLVGVFAPGTGVLSASNAQDDAYAELTGTSMAAAAVVGAVAQYLEHSPETAADAVRRIVQLAAAPLLPAHARRGREAFGGAAWTDGYLQTGPLERAAALYTTATAVDVVKLGATAYVTLYLRQPLTGAESVTVDVSVSHPDAIRATPARVTFSRGTMPSPAGGVTVAIETSRLGASAPVAFVDFRARSADPAFDGAVHAVAVRWRAGPARGATVGNAVALTSLGAPGRPARVWHDLNEMELVSSVREFGDIADRWLAGTVKILSRMDPPGPDLPFVCRNTTSLVADRDYWFAFFVEGGCDGGCALTVDTCGTHFDSALKVWDYTDVRAPEVVADCTHSGPGDDVGPGARVEWFPGFEGGMAGEERWEDVECGRLASRIEARVFSGRRYMVQIGKLLSSRAQRLQRVLSLHAQLDAANVTLSQSESRILGHERGLEGGSVGGGVEPAEPDSPVAPASVYGLSLSIVASFSTDAKDGTLTARERAAIVTAMAGAAGLGSTAARFATNVFVRLGAPQTELNATGGLAAETAGPGPQRASRALRAGSGHYNVTVRVSVGTLAQASVAHTQFLSAASSGALAAGMPGLATVEAATADIVEVPAYDAFGPNRPGFQTQPADFGEAASAPAPADGFSLFGLPKLWSVVVVAGGGVCCLAALAGVVVVVTHRRVQKAALERISSDRARVADIEDEGAEVVDGIRIRNRRATGWPTDPYTVGVPVTVQDANVFAIVSPTGERVRVDDAPPLPGTPRQETAAAPAGGGPSGSDDGAVPAVSSPPLRTGSGGESRRARRSASVTPADARQALPGSPPLTPSGVSLPRLAGESSSTHRDAASSRRSTASAAGSKKQDGDDA
ncbi:unnamed protein product [Pedinophyceae sp. YPF-701]|nr:unnamed protein product [Pedinophyceae sp. YPF-701]